MNNSSPRVEVRIFVKTLEMDSSISSPSSDMQDRRWQFGSVGNMEHREEEDLRNSFA
jgi:hypothetical protein